MIRPRLARSRPVPGRLLTATVTVALAAVACSGTGFRYVSNTNTQTFFKLPEEWRVFEQDEIFGGPIGETQQGAALAESTLWMVAFDGGPAPTVGALVDPSAEHPRGFANVRMLDPNERDVFSLRTLRNLVIPVDQMLTEEGGGGVEVLDQQEIVLEGGYHGTRLLVRAQLNAGAVVIDQTGVVDPETSTVYLFVIGCGEACFEQHGETIRQIADSWTVKE